MKSTTIDISLLFLAAVGMIIAFIKNRGTDSRVSQAVDSGQKIKEKNALQP